MIISDIATLLKNGFSHDEIMEISRGTAAPTGGTPEQQPDPVDHIVPDELIAALDAANAKIAELENRINSAAVQASENPAPEPERQPSIKEITESLIK